MGIENKFERPTPQQRAEELRSVAEIIGNNPPISTIFHGGGLVRSIVGIPLRSPQDSVIPDAKSETDMSDQRDPEGKSGKHKKAPPPIKENQLRHARNLSGLNGWHKGILYTNGRPMNRRNGNGKH